MKKCCFCNLFKPLEDFYNNKNVKSGKASFCKQCGKEKRDNYYEKNRAKVLEKQKSHNEKYLSKISEASKIKRKNYSNNYFKFKIKTDVIFKLKIYSRNMLNRAFRSILQEKNWSTPKALGCSWEHFKNHLESKFQEGMTWNNYAHDGWHIDHIIPISSAKTEEDIIRLSHYTNLQPLWAKDNLIKSNKMVPPTGLEPITLQL